MAVRARWRDRLRYWGAETADHRLRYAAVIDILRRDRPARVLEVGSGPIGLARYWPKVVGVDRSFPRPPAPGLRPTVGSATQLPFQDASFPVVVSVDMLEHLPAGEREAALKEMVRVTDRTLVLACPCGPEARLAERRLIEDWRGQLPDWLAEHQVYGLPDPEPVRRALAAAVRSINRTARVQELEAGGCEAWLRLTRSLRSPWLRLTCQPLLLLTWRWWREWASRGPAYRRVWLVDLAPVEAPSP